MKVKDSYEVATLKVALADVCLVGQYVMDPTQRKIQNRARTTLESFLEHLVRKQSNHTPIE